MSTENKTDYEILQQAFGSEYFIFCRLDKKLLLSAAQEENLQQLISDRNHFEILNLLADLRKSEKFRKS